MSLSGCDQQTPRQKTTTLANGSAAINLPGGSITDAPSRYSSEEALSDEQFAVTASVKELGELPEAIKACVTEGLGKIRAITDTFRGPERRAECEPAGLPRCSTTSSDVSLTVTLEGPWVVDGNLRIVPTSGPTGRSGFRGPTKVSDRTVEGSAHCRGEGCGGPGRWAAGYITGAKRRVPTDDDVRHIVGRCVQSGIGVLQRNSANTEGGR
jgi:hypothetical protein